MLRSILIILLFTTSTLSGMAQRNDKPRPFLKGSFQLPNPISNYSFKSLMSGVSDVGLSFNFPVGEKLYFGIILEHTYFNFDDLAIPEKTNASMQMTGSSLSLGYTITSSEKLSWDLAMNGGYSYILTFSETCESATGNKMHIQNGVTLRPNISVLIKSSDNLAFSMMISYNVVLSEFGPGNLCLQEFSGFASPDYSGTYQMFAIGFGFKATIPQGN